MKKSLALIAVALCITAAHAAPPPGYCDVTICNKLERFSLDPFKHMKDAFGKQCMPAILPISLAKEGDVLDSSSRWYQGSFNPTKQSVTRVSEVHACTPVPLVVQSKPVVSKK